MGSESEDVRYEVLASKLWGTNIFKVDKDMVDILVEGDCADVVIHVITVGPEVVDSIPVIIIKQSIIDKDYISIL